jgi:hypothetical protein
LVTLLLSLLVPLLHAAPQSETWWSLQPLKQPPVPKLSPEEGRWCRTPVDAFIQAKLQEQKLAPAPEAERRTLIRRLYFDLLGLPPTPEEIQAFVQDSAADAYERLVDRLLASPHYGERWARHWMDLVHFAETHGHDQDRIRPHAWRYRDYLIAAFNEDKPYARFVQEQLAADVLFPAEPHLIPALGLLAAGPWDESSLRDIRDDSFDRQVGYYLDRDDMVTTVMATFQSMTVHCARCHDHKFDPIPQEDYYSLQAVFAGVDKANRTYDLDAATHQRRQKLSATLAALDRHDPGLSTQLQDARFRKAQTAWEAKHLHARNQWLPVLPLRAVSAHGSLLAPAADGTIRSEGPRPETDIYTVTVRTRLKGITGVRLELLPDDKLPHHGPGRQENGNLHLSEFQVLAAPVKEGTPTPPHPVRLQQPQADYNQPGWTVQHAIDGNPKTAWGIYPQVGKAHEAVFSLAEPLGDGQEWEITFRLEQLHGSGHLLGKFRLALTTARTLVPVPPLPEAVATALLVPATQRTEAQQRVLGLFFLREQTTTALAALPPPLQVYAAAQEFAPDGGHKPSPTPRTVHVLKRGNLHRPGPVASPGTLSCVANLPARFSLSATATEGERRAALAQWLTRPDNPLTWRSIVNRVWHYHFGRGLVDTPNDFGHMGSLPTHPELLDWLAVTFREQGGSLKKLHRLLVTSAVYRQSSRHHAGFAAVDADNRYLWRMPRTRLDAEQVRDAILLLSGRLERTPGGPSDQQFALKPGPHVTPIIDYGKFSWDRPQGHRRSVYRFLFRTLPDPFMDSLDCADASQWTPVRNISVTAPQALALLNNEFILVHSKALAEVMSKRTPQHAQQISLACEQVWGRQPTASELPEMLAFVEKHGLANLCRLLFNSNEFLFVD